MAVMDGSFPEALNKALNELGVSIKEFSKLSGIPESTLYKITSGKRPDPQLSTLRQILSALKELEQGKSPQGLIWESRLLDGLGHVPAKSLEEGLRAFFSQ